MYLTNSIYFLTYRERSAHAPVGGLGGACAVHGGCVRRVVAAAAGPAGVRAAGPTQRHEPGRARHTARRQREETLLHEAIGSATEFQGGGFVPPLARGGPRLQCRRLLRRVPYGDAQERPEDDLTIMRQHDKLETVLRHFLVEDRGVDGSPLVRGLPVPRTQGDPAAALAAPRGRARRRPRLREVVSRHNWYTMSPMYNTGLLIEIKKNRNCIVMTSVD
ncbi:hypothetical protein O3G_MSEX015028 [Manduca sexta]|uniref:Uncharacterized protein n=1 Tax=Manduca sexta TaxID=7130 RepID=A0A921ZXB4_MANSE|nr:hypothetical protein O3G_MSEX015028 [Manduca sexta]